MKIAVDGFELNKSFTGVGRYLYNLLKALLTIDPNSHYTLFLKESPLKMFSAPNLSTVVLPTDLSHTRWQNSDLLQALRQGDFDLFFSPNHSLPLRYNGRSMLTVHDVSWKTMRRDYSMKERMVRDFKTRISLKKAELIFTISEFSRQEIEKYYRVPAEKIKTIHLAVEPFFSRSQPETVAAFKQKYRLGIEPIFGFLGGMFRRRHVKESLEAFKQLRQKRPAQFILVGKNHYGKELKELLRSPGVVWRERIDDADINAFYSSIEVLIYLSEYEGFGFPPLEALQCQTLPLLLPTSSLKEIYKDMAIFIDRPEPQRIEAILNQILDNKLPIKEQIFKTFQERRDYFSWARVAREYLTLFSQGKNVKIP